MEITSSCRDRLMTTRLQGELDHHGAKGLLEQLEREIDACLPRQLVLDFSAVSFMDSSGIAVVVRARRRMDALGGTVMLQNVPPQPRKVFEASGVTRLVKMS